LLRRADDKGRMRIIYRFERVVTTAKGLEDISGMSSMGKTTKPIT
jgi:hypothetical protein